MKKNRSQFTYRPLSGPVRGVGIPLLIIALSILLCAMAATGCASWPDPFLAPAGDGSGAYVPGPAAQILPSVGAAVGGPAGELAGAAVLGALNAFALWQNQKLKRRLNEHLADSK